jgi:ribosomal protein S18 acetylase RimI-like enzyme
MIEFRPANRCDLTTIQTMAEVIWHRHYYPDILSKEAIAYFLERMYTVPALTREMQAGAGYWIIECAGKTAGFFAYQHEPKHNKLRINKLYLWPEFQRLGIGGMALEKAKQAALNLGVDEIYLYVFRKNKAAVRAYQKHGFVIAREEFTPCEGGFAFDDYVMAYYPQVAPHEAQTV